jgi:hypothetical protein
MLAAGREALDAAQGLLDATGSLEQRAEWLRLTAAGQLRAGNPAQARRTLGDARQQAGRSGSVIARLATELGSLEAALAAGDDSTALAGLAKLHDEAQALGHVVLLLQSGELLALAQERAGQLADAEKQLRAGLRAADGHAPWAGRYRMHAELAGVLGRLGRAPDAARHLAAASDEVERLRKGLDASQRSSFDGLQFVKQIAAPAANDQAA